MQSPAIQYLLYRWAALSSIAGHAARFQAGLPLIFLGRERQFKDLQEKCRHFENAEKNKFIEVWEMNAAEVQGCCCASPHLQGLGPVSPQEGLR